MKVFEKPWVRLLINLGITVVLFFVLLFSLSNKEKSGAMLLGMFSLSGQIFYFLAFDTFGDKVGKKFELLRNVLVIIGSVIILFFAFFAFIMVLGKKEYGSPWLEAFATLWFLNGVIPFIFYYVIITKLWKKILNCFVPVVSLIISYFVSVIFLYLGSGVHEFFNFYLGLIISVILIIIMILIIKKHRGIPFFGTEVRKHQEQCAKKEAQQKAKNYGGSNALSGENDGEYVDNRKEPSAGLMNNTFEKFVRRAVENARTGYYCGQYGRAGGQYGADSISLECYVFNGKIRVKGSVVYEVTSLLSNLTENDLKEDAESVVSQIWNVIVEKVNEAVESYREEYKGYDEDMEIVSEGIKYRIKR